MTRGTVSVYDQGTGVGAIEADDGRVYSFHCTAITNGSRTIPAGVDVEFEPAPGHLGAWEATAISRV